MSGEDPIEVAADALDEGRPGDALAELASLPPDDPERALLAAQAHLDLSELENARRELAVAVDGLESDEPALVWTRAELHLREWRIDEARTLLESLDTVDASERLALCLELQGDFEGADRILAETARRFPEEAPLPHRLDEAAFDAVVEAAIAELPPPHRTALGRARVVTEPVPFRELAPDGDPGATPPDLLGLFVGETLHELAEDASARLPPTIYLFQRNLERCARDADELREEIRITLFHELGHLLGLDEDEVDALGLG